MCVVIVQCTYNVLENINYEKSGKLQWAPENIVEVGWHYTVIIKQTDSSSIKFDNNDTKNVTQPKEYIKPIFRSGP